MNHNSDLAGIYDLTDGVPDETFEEALNEAKEEGNLSRANVFYFNRPERLAQRSTSGQCQTSPMSREAMGSGKSGWRRRHRWTTWVRFRPRRLMISLAPTNWSTSTLRPMPADATANSAAGIGC